MAGSPHLLGDVVSGVISFIGIGANMERPAEACRSAIGQMAEIAGVRLLRTSSFYRTEPVGPTQQEWFINAVAEIRTGLAPVTLLTALKGIEQSLGRTQGERWGPRVIDLDILLYGQEVIHEEGLIIPHPELHKRRFVLVPLCELASYAIHPGYGVSVRGLLDRLTDPARVELFDPMASDERRPAPSDTGMDKVEMG